MISRIRERLQGPSGHFVKSSLVLAVGFAIARVLGLLFSLLLGRVLPAESYGYIQYSILLAGIFAIGTQPLMQHTLARFISVSRGDQQQLNRIFSTTFFLLGLVTVLTTGVVMVFFAVSGSFNLGALIIFICITIYYAYYGLARGFEDSTRLSAVFIGSNLVQFIAILVAYFVFHSRDTLPALAIYGLSYIGPVLYLSLRHPLPVRFERALIQREQARELTRFSVPVWGSHALFAFGAAADVFLLTVLVGPAAAGAFAFTRTLGIVFDFLPAAIGTIIMPRVASPTASARRLTLVSLGLVTAVSAAIAVVFLALYPWAVTTFFDPSYQLPITTVLLIIIGQTLYGLHGVLTGVAIGQNRATVDLASRVLVVASLYVGCDLLIPLYGVDGAALANVITAGLAVVTFPLLIKLLGRRQTPALADSPAVQSS